MQSNPTLRFPGALFLLVVGVLTWWFTESESPPRAIPIDNKGTADELVGPMSPADLMSPASLPELSPIPSEALEAEREVRDEGKEKSPPGANKPPLESSGSGITAYPEKVVRSSNDWSSYVAPRGVANCSQEHITWYIRKYMPAFKEEERIKGIPATLIACQAVLEGAAGSSKLFMQTNNHFGIKGSQGLNSQVSQSLKDKGLIQPSVRMRDRSDHYGRGSNDYYRSYTTSWASIRDHSDLLLNGKYKSGEWKYPSIQKLIQTHNTNFSSWAEALEKDGYCASWGYASKLKKLKEALGL